MTETIKISEDTSPGDRFALTDIGDGSVKFIEGNSVLECLSAAGIFDYAVKPGAVSFTDTENLYQLTLCKEQLHKLGVELQQLAESLFAGSEYQRQLALNKGQLYHLGAELKPVVESLSANQK